MRSRNGIIATSEQRLLTFHNVCGLLLTVISGLRLLTVYRGV